MVHVAEHSRVRSNDARMIDQHGCCFSYGFLVSGEIFLYYPLTHMWYSASVPRISLLFLTHTHIYTHILRLSFSIFILFSVTRENLLIYSEFHYNAPFYVALYFSFGIFFVMHTKFHIRISLAIRIESIIKRFMVDKQRKIYL